MPAEQQYEFYVIERQSLKDLSMAQQFVEGEYFNIKPFWVYSRQGKGLFSEMHWILKKNKSWSDEIDLYGIQESSCLEVYFDENDYIESVVLRIDFSQPFEFILKGFITFCISKDLVIIDENLHKLPLDFELFAKVIQSSERWEKYFWGDIKD